MKVEGAEESSCLYPVQNASYYKVRKVSLFLGNNTVQLLTTVTVPTIGAIKLYLGT